MIENVFYQRDIISTKDFNIDDISLLLKIVNFFKSQVIKNSKYNSLKNINIKGESSDLRLQRKRDYVNNYIPDNKINNLLNNKIIASCFFEPSTRTRLSFESAAVSLGAKVIGFDNAGDLSVQKGESFSDTLKVISAYADLIVIRHPNSGAAMLAAETAEVPVINAGDGPNQHPTQALTDIFTISEFYQDLRGLSVAVSGDLKYSRTVHSLLELCSLYDIRLYLVSSEDLALPDEECNKLKKRGLRFSFHESIDEVLTKIDVLYLTRIQKERSESDNSSVRPLLKSMLLKKARHDLKILHPLPRLSELPNEIDQTDYAGYFQQAKNGLFVRQALLNLILNESLL